MIDRRAFVGRSVAAAGALGAGSAWATAARAAPAAPHLKELAKAIHGAVIARGNAGYDQARLLESTRFDAVHPQAIVQCTSAADVAATIRWARKHGIHLVPRSGGHSYGGYSTTSGVVVDVGRMNTIRVAPDAKTAVIGAGARLIDVYSQLFQHGKTIPAGSCATVGIAGLALGGGVGFSSRKYGLTCDNVRSLQIVTAAGAILTCDATHHADLYWACRGGGGGNFGIVTSFTFALHPAPSVTTFSVEWPWEQAMQAIQAWQAFAPTAPDELFSICDLLSTGPGPGNRSHMVVSGQYLGGEAALTTLLQPLTGAGTPTRVTTRTRTSLEANLFWAGCSGETVGQCHLSPRGTLQRSSFLAKSDYVAKPLSPAAIATLTHAMDTRQNDPSLGAGALLMDSQGGAINRVAKDATAFVHRDQLFSIQYVVQLGSAATPTRVAANAAWLANLHSALGTAVSGQAYQNYIDPTLAGWGNAYYGSNLARLRAVKHAYDPTSFFTFPQSINRAA